MGVIMRAGDSAEDYCRVCKIDRMHTVVAADAGGVPLRVVCGYCRSEHNYRGGPRTESGPSAGGERGSGDAARVRPDREPFPIVSERERVAPAMSGDHGDIEM